MKKITSLLLIILALFTVLSFASCNEKTTEEIINEAIENTSKLTEYEAKMDITMDMAMSGMTINLPMNTVMKIKDADKENPIISATTTTSMLGQSMTIETYMDSEYVYIVEDGDGYKISVDTAMDDYDYTSDVEEMLKKLPADLLADMELTEKDDGSVGVSITLPDETFKDVFGDLIESMNEAAEGDVIDDLKVADCNVSVFVKDDYISTYEISFNMEMSMMGIKADTAITVKMELVNPGEAVTITPPEGYQNFNELTGSDY